jgi:glycine cleavage system H protein
MNFPDNLKYTKDHEWISVQGKIGTIGVTDYAQGELGDVVFIDINSAGEDIKAGDSIGTIEAVKTVSDIYAPCSGKIVEVNGHLQTQPEVVNTDPYGLGWMVKIEIADPSELNSLLDAEAYKKLIGKF